MFTYTIKYQVFTEEKAGMYDAIVQDYSKEKAIQQMHAFLQSLDYGLISITAIHYPCIISVRKV